MPPAQEISGKDAAKLLDRIERGGKGVAKVVIFDSDRTVSLRPGGLLFETGGRFSRPGAGELAFQRGDRTHQIVALMYLPLR
jgi:hypothetical protein